MGYMGGFKVCVLLLLMCFWSTGSQEIFGRSLCQEDQEGNETGFEFVYFGGTKSNFTQGAEICQSISGTLASVRSILEHELIVALLETLGEEGKVLDTFYIGVVVDEDINSSLNNTGSYSFLDGYDDNSFLDVGQGNFPWLNGGVAQPDNQEGETVVEYLLVNNRWNNNNPDLLRHFLCRAECVFEEVLEKDEEVLQELTLIAISSVFGSFGMIFLIAALNERQKLKKIGVFK
eukprot:snap_masked-scaffold_1-processed-gene-5.24-mRNA-1 protein AED:1.00 eAED:1.00 QI:0/-1/0/0/-1/1/1/0/232